VPERAAKFEVVTSLAQLDELRRASRYPKFQAILQPHWVGAMVNNLQRTIVLDELPSYVEANNSNNAFLLVMVTTGDADYLVMRDRALDSCPVRGLLPRHFCSEVL
jgi:hypothetical protein